MPEQSTIIPARLADQLGITIITLRRWCVAFGDHLSPGANPLPGVARRFTYRDREVLRYVKQERDQGRSLAEIADQLVDLSFPDIVDPTDDQPADQPAQPTTIEAHPDPRNEGYNVPLVQVAREDIVRLFTRVEALEQSQEKSRQNRVSDIVLGVLLALGFMVVILLLASIYGAR